MPIEIKPIDTRFASEKAGLEVIKSVKEIEGAIQPVPFHKHTGNDGSPKLDFINITNKESSEGGKYGNTVRKINAFSTSATDYASVTDLSISIVQTVNEKRYLLLFTGNISNDTSDSAIQMAFSVNGTDTMNLVYANLTNGATYTMGVPASMHYITDELTQGTHTFIVRMKVGGNTGTLRAGSVFSIIELTT